MRRPAKWVSVSTSVPRDEHELIKAYADIEGLTVSGYIRQCVLNSINSKPVVQDVRAVESMVQTILTELKGLGQERKQEGKQMEQMLKRMEQVLLVGGINRVFTEELAYMLLGTRLKEFRIAVSKRIDKLKGKP